MTRATAPTITFDNSFSRLSSVFYRRTQPEAVSKPELIAFNHGLSEQLGIDVSTLTPHDLASVFSGNQLPEGADPLAMVYAGHQFGHFSPQLGDGRALLLGEVVDSSGQRLDIQLKGSGRTPYSRNGDGRAWLGPVLREYLVSEAMHALGVPGTRALAAVATGDTVYREQPYPGAVLTRVSNSHIRVGTFQYFAATKAYDALRELADYTLARHYPDIDPGQRPYHTLLETVIERQVKLVSHWQSIGFIHGVMNTDNASITGDTIDFGPCAFMDTFHPATVFSAIDHGGRYAWHNQPAITHWNMVQLAQALLPLFGTNAEQSIEEAQSIVDQVPIQFTQALNARWKEKLGLSDSTDSDVDQLVTDLLTTMEQGEADFNRVFRELCTVTQDSTDAHNQHFLSLFTEPQAASAWLARWQSAVTSLGLSDAERCRQMQAINPRYIPRNHQIERLISAGVDGDFSVFDEFRRVLATPFDEQHDQLTWSLPPQPEERVTQTFCGT